MSCSEASAGDASSCRGVSKAVVGTAVVWTAVVWTAVVGAAVVWTAVVWTETVVDDGAAVVEGVRCEVYKSAALQIVPLPSALARVRQQAGAGQTEPQHCSTRKL